MRLRIVFMTWALCAAALSGANAANAANAKPKLAVLGIEPLDEGDTSSQERTASLAKWITDGLRERAERARARYDLAPNSNKELTEVKLLSDCLDEARDCMAAIGRDLNADYLMFGRLERRRDTYALTLRLLNVGTKSFEKQKTDSTASTSANEATMRRMASAVFAELTGIPLDGTIAIEANVPSGTVFVNGERRGMIAARTATIEGLPEGRARVVVEADGYKRWEGQVDVRPGASVRLAVSLRPDSVERTPTLSATSPPPSDRPSGRPGKMYRTLAWTSAVLTAGGVAAFTITGLKVRSLEQDKEAAIRTSWDDPDGGITGTSDACKEADEKGYAPVDSICRDGKRMAKITNILIGLSAAAFVATGVFAYEGYIAADRPPPEQARKASSRRVTVVPEIFPTGAGLGAVIQF
ncbi:MAG: PEGA domain-containing protein [Deltaproteobacteria bacterium]|nr:PEGA domain-containing protein [Deltaproteobacteria bacterium]